MALRPRKPSVLAYQAVRGADTTDDARTVYAAMKASPCHTADICVMAESCPFVIDCRFVEAVDDAGG
jgi:hypothetical protein